MCNVYAMSTSYIYHTYVVLSCAVLACAAHVPVECWSCRGNPVILNPIDLDTDIHHPGVAHRSVGVVEAIHSSSIQLTLIPTYITHALSIPMMALNSLHHVVCMPKCRGCRGHTVISDAIDLNADVHPLCVVHPS